MKTNRTRAGIVVAVVCAAGSYEASAQTIALVPKSSTGAFSLSGNEITTTPGSIVTLEFTAYGWGQAEGGPELIALQATLDPMGYLGVNVLPPNPGVDLLPLGYALPDPNGGSRGEGLFFTQSVCQLSGRDCTLGQVPAQPPCDVNTEGFCVTNPRWVLVPGGPLAIVERTSLNNYICGTVSQVGSHPDLGEPDHGYFGTLRLVIPPNAAGAYTVGFNSDPLVTFMLDQFGLEILGLTTVPARITVVPAVPPQPAFGPHDIVKNRYVSFVPAGGEVPQAYQIRLASSTFDPDAVGFVGWVAAPSAGFNSSSMVHTTPVFRVWDEFIVHAGDCEIQPGATYEIRGTTDGIVFSTPLVIETAAQPSGGKEWGDVAGVNDGSQWTAPNGIANVHDILAIRSLITLTDPIPPFYRVNLQATSTADPCLNSFVNTADTFMAILAVSGQPYPFETDPALCPVCP